MSERISKEKPRRNTASAETECATDEKLEEQRAKSQLRVAGVSVAAAAELDDIDACLEANAPDETALAAECAKTTATRQEIAAERAAFDEALAHLGASAMTAHRRVAPELAA